MPKIYLLFLFSLLSLHARCQQDIINYNKSVIKLFRSSTVCLGEIESYKDSNKHLKKRFSVIGSGILFYLRAPNNQIARCIVTAKHVVYDPSDGWLPNSLQIRLDSDDTLSFAQGLGVTVNLISHNTFHWFPHPDSNVDLACIPLIFGYNLNIKDSSRINAHSMPYNSIASDSDIFDGEDILALGFPGFAGNDVLVKSILRQGVISWTNPKNPEENTLLIDCNIFPGNSGGPVFTKPIFSPSKFLGIVTQVYYEPQQASDSTFKNRLLNFQHKQIFLKQYSALGVVEPASRVKEILNYANSYFKKN